MAILSIAIGVGVNAAMFSFADALVLRPLPVARPGEILTLSGTAPDIPGTRFGSLSYPDYVDLRDRNRSFDGLVAFIETPVGVTETPDALPRLRLAMMVSGNFFKTMGVRAAMGREFSPEDDRAGGSDTVVVLGHDFWEKTLAADPHALGRKFRLNGVEFTVVGVAPKEFTGMDTFVRPDLFVPIATLPRVGTQAQAKLLTDRGARSVEVKGRLKSGIGLAQAAAEMNALSHALEEEHPDTDRQHGIKLLTEIEMRHAQSPPNAELALMLMGVAALVLIIACANVANLLLSRARARSREITVRLAIGAGRRHLLAQLLTESLVLGLAGGAVSLLFANAAIEYLSRTPFASDLPISITVLLDRRALIFSLAASLASVLLFGLGPALRSSGTNVALCLKTGEANTGRRRIVGRSLLVVAQVALSLMLLSCATLFYQSFREVLLGSPGFRTDHLLLLSFDPALVRYSPEKADRFYRALVDSVRKLPGVRNAALTQAVPFGTGLMGKEIVPEDKQLAPGKVTDSVFTDTVGDRYFETIGTSIQEGRGFLPTDTADSPRVAVINRVLADRYWPKQSAVGKRFRLDGPTGPWVQIIGVAQTAKYVFVGEAPLSYLYLPVTQNPAVAMTLLVEAAGDAASLAEPVRQVARSLDGYQPVFDVRTMRDFYEQRAVRVMQMIVVIVATMGLLGLILALVGLYGLVSYSVSRRTREIGIRMAVGAEWGDILRMVLRQGLVLAGTGIAIGIVGSFGLIRLLGAVFSQTSADWLHLWGFAAMLLAVFAITTMACYIPARRAATIDANRALHWD